MIVGGLWGWLCDSGGWLCDSGGLLCVSGGLLCERLPRVLYSMVNLN